MLKIREAIVVEGRYDKNTLSQEVDALIIPVDGFQIFKKKDTVQMLRKLAATQGLIIFTDSDGAGFVIRNHLKGVLPQDQVKHAYIPDIYGKERRKATAGKEGKLGVEGMRPEVLKEALLRAGATVVGEEMSSQPRRQITRSDRCVFLCPCKKSRSIRQISHEIFDRRGYNTGVETAWTKSLECVGGRNMNQLFVGMKKIPVEQGSGYNVAYYILVEEAETEDGVLCDQYGLRVVLLGSEGKQSASIRQITTYPDSIYRLAQEVMTHLVTPAALQDVVDDWLAAV